MMEDRERVPPSPCVIPNKMTHIWGGTNNTVRVSVKASPAEGRRRLHKKHGLCGDAPHEGLFQVERREFRYFRCLGARYSGFRVRVFRF